MKLRAIRDTIIVKYEEKNVTARGLIIPAMARNNPDRGIIVSVGPGDWDAQDKPIEMILKVGQKVLFGRSTGVKVKHGNDVYLVMKQSDVQRIVHE